MTFTPDYKQDSFHVEILHLRARLLELTETANTNDALLKRIVAVGLSILQQPSLSELFRFLSNEFRLNYELDRVTVYLVDRDREIERLLLISNSSITAFPKIVITANDEITRLLSGGAQCVPSADSTVDTERLFPRRTDEPSRKAWLGTYSADLHESIFPGCSGLASVALLPLVAGTSRFGLFALASKDAKRFSPGLSTYFLELLAALVAVSISTQVTTSRLQLTGLVDSQTGVFNRRYLDARLAEEVQRSSEEGVGMACMVVDADHFKRINDTFGHPAG